MRNLLGFLGPNSVVLLDNARVHRNSNVFTLLNQNNRMYILNAPYSPDYNAIELFWATFKQHLRKMHVIPGKTFDQMVVDALRSVTSNNYGCAHNEYYLWRRDSKLN